MSELLIGCGNQRKKLLAVNEKKEWTKLTTLDIDETCNPDVVWDLNNVPLPFKENEFDEIHAYETLEHIGTQGDYKFFFNQFTDFWRILKPGGLFYATVPKWNTLWSWGDPGHTRIINEGTITFLSQKRYAEIGKTAMTDYRWCYQADFDFNTVQNTETNFIFVLNAVKQ